MGFWKKLLSKSEESVPVVKVSLSLDELTIKVNDSILQVKESVNLDLAHSTMNNLLVVKKALRSLMNREIRADYNKALMIGANNARKRINDQLKPLLTIKQPIDLESLNVFIKRVELLLVRAVKVFNESRHAQLLFKNEINNLSHSLTLLTESVNRLKKELSVDNTRLVDLNSLDREVKLFYEYLREIKELNDDRALLNKRLQSYRDDKERILIEVSKIKGGELFNELVVAKQSLKDVAVKKSALEHSTMNIVSKFTRALKKTFRGDSFVNELLINPLVYIASHEQDFNKQVSQLIKELKSGSLKLEHKETDKALKALSNQLINKYLVEYNELLKQEELLNKKDFSLLAEVIVLEERLNRLSDLIKQESNGSSAIKESIVSKESIIKLVKVKVESLVRKIYDEIISLD